MSEERERYTNTGQTALGYCLGWDLTERPAHRLGGAPLEPGDWYFARDRNGYAWDGFNWIPIGQMETQPSPSQSPTAMAASDMMEELGFSWFARVLRGEVELPQNVRTVLAEGPVDWDFDIDEFPFSTFGFAEGLPAD